MVGKDQESGLHFYPHVGCHPLAGAAWVKENAGFLAGARTKYDLIILDSPPVLALSMPSCLPESRMLPSCSHAGKHPREVTVSALRQLKATNTVVAGVVLKAG